MENERDDEREPEREQREENRNDDRNDQQNDDENDQQQQQPQQQGKKCPRCESFNTKFCYYNNYSLSQPRYFCKACRRYWTHGGTLRNVPVGGGCRKPKRGRPSTSATANPNPPPLPAMEAPTLQAAKPIIPTLPSISTNESMFASLGNSYFQNGTFSMSSLVGCQPLNNPPPSFSQFPVSLGNGVSNMAMLQGFNNPPNSFNISQPNQQGDFFDVGGQGKKVAYDHSLTNSQPLTGPTNDSWQQSFVNSAPDGMWRFDHGGTSKNVDNIVGSSFNSNQWFDLPGYGLPPP